MFACFPSLTATVCLWRLDQTLDLGSLSFLLFFPPSLSITHYRSIECWCFSIAGTATKVAVMRHKRRQTGERIVPHQLAASHTVTLFSLASISLLSICCPQWQAHLFAKTHTLKQSVSEHKLQNSIQVQANQSQSLFCARCFVSLISMPSCTSADGSLSVRQRVPRSHLSPLMLLLLHNCKVAINAN